MSLPPSQENKTLANLLTYFLLAAVGLTLLFPVIFTKAASFCILPDNLHQAYPFFNKLATSLHKGYLPLWDANSYSGKNFAGEFQTGIYYPLNILWCLVFGSAKGIDVYYLDLLVALHYFICLFGMYSLSRAFRLTRDAAIASALIFTFTGVLSSRSGGQTCIFAGLAWMPWAIYFTAKFYFTQKRKRYLVYSGLICGLEILGGHIQPFFHTLMICGIIIVFFEYNDRKDWKSFALIVLQYALIIVVPALLISLPQDYYAAQYLSHAYRWVGADQPIVPGQKVPFSIYAYKYIITPAQFPNLLNRNFTQPDDGNLLYAGIIPVLLLIGYLLKRKQVRETQEHVRLRKILMLIFWIGLLSTLGYITFVSIILYEIPFVNSIRELGRYGVLINFSGALFAGLALTYLGDIKNALTSKFKVEKFYILAFLCLNAIYLAFFEKKNTFQQNFTIPVLLSLLFFLILLRSQNLNLLRSIFILVLFADLFLNRVSYSSTESDFYPPRYYGRNSIINFLETTYGKYRVAYDMQQDELQRRNLGDVYNIQLKMGYCATMNMPYFDFISRDWALNSEVNDLLNVKYVLTDKQMDSSFIFKDSTGGIKLYERKNFYPRVYWKSQLGQRGPEIEEENRDRIKPLVYSDSYQKVEVDCPSSDTLIFSENFYPGWKCRDNGNRISIFAPTIKNYPSIFRAIYLEKGRHTIEFSYSKPFFLF